MLQVNRDYDDFLANKQIVAPSAGVDIEESELNSAMFPVQKAATRWALRKGRAALFFDTGLGKAIMSLEWARKVSEKHGPVLYLAPLAVAKQIIREHQKFKVECPIRYAREHSESSDTGITITNYEMLNRFDPSRFDGVVLDESSILKSMDGKTRKKLTEAFRETPMRLCCSATPAPNDIGEIGNHAEFLSIMTRQEMNARFFVHDDNGWRMKRHAVEPFYRWLASWGMTVKKPSDLGFDDSGFTLPPLTIEARYVPDGYKQDGTLFALKLKGITERSEVRKHTLAARVASVVELIESDLREQWIVWCALNDESMALVKALERYDAVEVKGSDSPERKEDVLLAFSDNRVHILITKPSIAGFGMNWQNCARTVFCGIGDSYEQYYQALRRIYRFGQQREVRAYVVLGETESPIYENVLRKEKEAETMGREIIKHVAVYEKRELTSQSMKAEYETRYASGDNWDLFMGDSAEVLTGMDSQSVDLAVFSPPFSTLYTYSDTDRDIGNCKSDEQFFEHFGFLTRELLRVVKPGRNVCCHVQQLATTKSEHGVIGLRDFRGQVISHFVSQGFIYHGEICIDKDPQAQAIRTHSKALLFVQLKKDASWLRPALADYVLIFRAPGDNAVPVHPDLSNDEWIEWARPIWYGIKESDTLQGWQKARGEKDERHICPLQLGTIERCIRLWSNKGERVLSPFAGIGSEGHEAIRTGRKFTGIELKPEYWQMAKRNLEYAEAELKKTRLF